MAEKEFKYVTVRIIGKVNGNEVEVGHYDVNGKPQTDKIYLVSHFTRRNGTEDTKATPICLVSEAKEISKLLANV